MISCTCRVRGGASSLSPMGIKGPEWQDGRTGTQSVRPTCPPPARGRTVAASPETPGSTIGLPHTRLIERFRPGAGAPRANPARCAGDVGTVPVRNRRVVAIEDDAALRSVIVDILAEEDHQVV